MSQTALIITVPEAEQLVGEYRDRYDPSAMFGVPAHLSLLYPFAKHEALNEEIL